MASSAPEHPRRQIRRLLVANRAEIAARVFATCRELGIETVAVHSEADAGLPYVAEADHAVALPGNTPAETYLRGEVLIAAAESAGADAIHPGYGFLSESADFARAVLEVGLTWVGPSPEAIEQMGSKIAAKQLMREAGVPVLEAPTDPTEADLPLLVKASAGGGGRGMRIVRDLDALPVEIAAAEAEAASAFGDGTVFTEPYVERGRHVEVQVVCDAEGNGCALGDRDCSVQRRHQKVIEEAPAPGLSEATRQAMNRAALLAARAVGYLNAGTVEFLYDPDTGRFFFLEMNTRLQVEHPVTELVTGVDLVAVQLGIAEGRGLDELLGFSAGGAAPAPTGHAIEARLYAEDPDADWQPQSGRLTRLEFPDLPGLRVDAGFASGSEVSTYYDAMLAKVIVHAPTREQAARVLATALDRARIHGLRTNRDLLVRILREETFVAGEVSTAFLTERPVLGERGRDATADADAAVAAALAIAEHERARRRVQANIPVGWRNVPSQPQVTEFDGEVRVEWWGGRDGYRVEGVEVLSASPSQVRLVRDGVATGYAVSVEAAAEAAAEAGVVEVDWPGGHRRLVRVPRFTDPADAVASGSLLAPMPGTVVATPAEDQVTQGEPVVVLEAMKMQHTITAPTAGALSDLIAVGTQVAAGDVLAVISPTDTDGGQAS